MQIGEAIARRSDRVTIVEHAVTFLLNNSQTLLGAATTVAPAPAPVPPSPEPQVAKPPSYRKRERPSREISSSDSYSSSSSRSPSPVRKKRSASPVIFPKDYYVLDVRNTQFKPVVIDSRRCYRPYGVWSLRSAENLADEFERLNKDQDLDATVVDEVWAVYLSKVPKSHPPVDRT
jgi:hypothetical protein